MEFSASYESSGHEEFDNISLVFRVQMKYHLA